MKALLLVLLLASIYAKANWAVIVAGSNDWSNYRHQADVSHMHTLLLQHGFDAAHIIDMQYDDIADDSSNPHPGTIINKPDGPNVYPGHDAIDYKGDDVTPENFLAILAGNKSEQHQKVVESTSEDNIFVFYSDHGGPGILAFPSGGYLHANDWIRTIKEMHGARKFHNMVIYVEACHAGSMFSDILPPNVNVYTTTAANPHESSWAYYCDDPDYGTCLGDEYSVKFLEDLDQAQYHKWTLQEQFVKVRTQTEKSHVMQYGDLKGIPKEPVENYMAFGKFFQGSVPPSKPSASRIPQADVPAVLKWKKYTNAKNDAAKAAALADFQAEMAKRSEADARMTKLALALGRKVDDLTTYKANARDVEMFKAAIADYQLICGKLTDYTQASHTIALVNALNSGVSLGDLRAALRAAC